MKRYELKLCEISSNTADEVKSCREGGEGFEPGEGFLPLFLFLKTEYKKDRKIMTNKEYWDRLIHKYETMSDEEFMHLMEEIDNDYEPVFLIAENSRNVSGQKHENVPV